VDEFPITYSQYVNKKYAEFYKKNGYIPAMFNPYNCSEIKDVAPTLTTPCGSLVVSSTVLILEVDDK
jgi:hypothetical protein